VTDDGQQIELRLSAQRSVHGNGGGHIWQVVFKPDEALIKPGLRLSFGDSALMATVRQQREDIAKLWEVQFDPTDRPLTSWLETLGRPIKYDYVQ